MKNPFTLFAQLFVWAGAAGVTAAYFTRKWAFVNLRGLFGWSVKENGVTTYYHINSDGTGADTSNPHKTAYFARIVFNFAQASLGLFAYRSTKNQALKNAGLGMAFGGLANLMLQVFAQE